MQTPARTSRHLIPQTLHLLHNACCSALRTPPCLPVHLSCGLDNSLAVCAQGDTEDQPYPIPGAPARPTGLVLVLHAKRVTNCAIHRWGKPA
ncbi:hypothetical protein BU24DRAFT_424977 [Aaosphaeria arxii CBS 175.79]|uniref:Uncharacterized protein n=1 Tax=Aaosphaeria arxii CBS 175.79 TaxID=1450172 RepID=A0A6A5XM71_9PLEO|nr:uncharacterized protein BU24DRAFT_424977 [Aaosphaeria arxii CBS 175.79]KAF2013969.1 hypothetical protein BU24DRAFT_424977 [Aaosphaeria arxii CBS 175.79]